jgi:excisionase family DNA binding protein
MQTQSPKPWPERLAYSPREFALYLGTGHDVIYRAIARGELVARKLGRRTLITAEDGQRYLDALPRLQKALETA